MFGRGRGVVASGERPDHERHAHDDARRDGHTWTVGFDPTRKYKKTRFDYAYVAASVIVCVALVIWALA